MLFSFINLIWLKNFCIVFLFMFNRVCERPDRFPNSGGSFPFSSDAISSTSKKSVFACSFNKYSRLNLSELCQDISPAERISSACFIADTVFCLASLKFSVPTESKNAANSMYTFFTAFVSGSRGLINQPSIAITHDKAGPSEKNKTSAQRSKGWINRHTGRHGVT